MSGKSPVVTPLQLRKQLLIAESELNRVQLAGDLAAISVDVRAFTVRAQSFGTIASSAAALVTGLVALRRSRMDVGAKPSRIQSVLKGASYLSTLWLAFRSRRREQEESQ